MVSLLTVLAGCDKGSAPAGKQEQAPAEVRLGYFANLTHAQAVLGVSSGEFQKAIGPAKLQTKVFNAGPSLVEALLAGEIDIGYVGPSPAVAAYTVSKGSAIKVVSGAAANGVVIVAREDAPITSLADLAGKRLATPQHANTQDVAARHYVQSQLKEGKEGSVTVLPIPNAEQVSMMQRGQIDAAWVPEPWGARLVIETKAKIIAEEKDLWDSKQFATTVVIASPKFIQKHPETLRKLLEVHRGWTQRLQSDPAGQLPQLKTALFGLTGKKLPEGTLEQAITRVTFTDDPLLPSIQTMAGWAYDLGFSKQQPKLDALVDPQFAAPAPSPTQGGGK